jgi:PAS domain S-box-containing protein
MYKIRLNNTYKKVATPAIPETIGPEDILRHLAFDNSLQPNIITMVVNGRIIMVNNAACKLLGYSKKELLTKTRSAIFDIKELSFKKMLKQRTAEGHSKALVTAIKKNGKTIPCEITSAVFQDNGIEKAITTITDMSQYILKQQEIDTKKEKIVADDIALVKTEQKVIDTRNEKIVADDIALAKSEQKIIDTKKEKIVADDIALVKTEQKVIDTRNEKTVADNILLAKWRQEEIDIRKEQIVADDIILAQAKSDNRLTENHEWIKSIAQTSYDVMWDWNVTTGEIYIGDSVEEVFGYKVQNDPVTFTDFSRKILPQQKEAFENKLFKALASGEKTWSDSFSVKRKDGFVACVIIRATIVRDEKGRALRLIGAIQDVSKQKELEEKLAYEIATKTGYMEGFALIFNSSTDILFDADLVTNEVMISDAYEKEFGYKIGGKIRSVNDWFSHIHPEDKQAVTEDYKGMLASYDMEWRYSYRFLRADNSVATVVSNCIILRDVDGKAYRMIGYMHDVDKQTVLEEKLEHEIWLREQEIANAMQDAKETERSDIAKELHDNVNQLLGASKLYLNMAKRGGVNAEMYMSRSSEYTITAIEEIRKLTQGLTSDIIKTLGLGDAIDNVSADAMEVNPVKISCAYETFIENSVSYKFKLNVLRIVQEQLNNILKHAGATEATITLLQNKNAITLTISDNGVGFNTKTKQQGIGLTNIKSRAASYKGTAEFVSQPGQGCALTVRFPLTINL